jgi:hypothetical protein
MKRYCTFFRPASHVTVAAALLSITATVGCKDATGPTTGATRVTVTTAGLDLDADGYMVTVDGEPTQSAGPVDAVTLRELATGRHTVGLGGVADNCAVGGDNPRIVTVTARDTAAVAFTVGCAPIFGSFRVIMTTTGADLDPDGFALVLDSGSERPVAVSDTALLSPVPLGAHTVELRGIAVNCAVDGTPLRAVSLAPGAAGDTIRPTAEVAFAVMCVALSGTVRVTAATTGADLDADGYLVSVDGGPGQAVGVNDVIVIEGLKAGAHLVALGGVAANCAVDGANPWTVSITRGATAEVDFAVSCAAVTGSIRVTAATAGVDLDPDGYSVSVDGGPGQPLAVNGTITIPGLLVGDHTVAVGGIAANCVVDGANPRPVTVTAGASAEVVFAVDCTATTGWVRVTVTTTGADLDPDGYAVWVDPGCDAYEAPCAADATIGVNDAVTIGVEPGGHAVELVGLAANCAVSGANPRAATVTAGDTAEVAFAVTCVATGSVRVTASTTGAEVDPNGYVASVDVGPAYPLDVNATVTIPALLAGGHNVSLGDVASNCRVLNGGNPRSVVVTAGETADVTFEVTCAATADMIAADYAWCSDNGFFSGCGTNIVVMLANGSERYFVADGTEPAWSPDGVRLAYNAFDPVDNTPSGGRSLC